MGVARLLAKGWVVFCLFAGAHALRLAILRGEGGPESVEDVFLPLILFAAMGAVFIAGYGLSGNSGVRWQARFKPHRLVPAFNELVFIAFVLLSFINQTWFAPAQMGSTFANSVSLTMGTLVPGQRALLDQLSCGLDGGRVFASAFTWILALIYLGSASSRLKLAAGLLRIERMARPEPLGPLPLALVLATFAIVGIQLLFVGSVYPWLPCSAFTDISGALLIGLAPLMLSYLIVAAMAATLAMGPE